MTESTIQPVIIFPPDTNGQPLYLCLTV